MTSFSRWCGAFYPSVVTAILMGVFAFSAASCLRPGCVNKVRDVAASPDGRLKLVVFSRECGGEESNLQASVLEAAEKLPERGGNAVVVDDGEVEFSWKSDGGILVAYKRGARFYKQEESIRGVAVEYRERS